MSASVQDPYERRAETPKAEPDDRAPGSRKQVYLRTVYALNPGIPHCVDVPGGWG
jgi:hypothetical protein